MSVRNEKSILPHQDDIMPDSLSRGDVLKTGGLSQETLSLKPTGTHHAKGGKIVFWKQKGEGSKGKSHLTRDQELLGDPLRVGV